MTEHTLTTHTALLDEIPLERLEAEITGFASRIAAATATWLLWIAAYDRRNGWTSWQAKSCAHWLNWHCGVSPRTARAHVHVAHKLTEFTELRDTFLAGELSYSKVRAIARVVTPENEAQLINTARDATASQLERMLNKLPSPADNNDEDAETSDADCTFRNNGDGTMTMTITLPIDEMSHARATVNKATASTIAREQTDNETRTDTMARLGGLKAIRANTAAALITGNLDAPRGTEHTVLVVADIETLTGQNPQGESTVDSLRVDPAVTQRLTCDGKIQAALLGHDGTEKACGTETRLVPRWLRRLLQRRDHGMCQFPGCESEHRLHAHHIIHWANSGPTELDNLISLCHFHHHSVHEGGWNIITTEHGWAFHDPAGNRHHVPLLRLPTQTPLPDTNGNRKTGPAGPLAGTGERADMAFAINILTTNAQLQAQRRAKADQLTTS